MNILVTGGTGGLGRAVVELLVADKGNRIFFTYCHLTEEARSITDTYPNITGTQCNYTENEHGQVAEGN